MRVGWHREKELVPDGKGYSENCQLKMIYFAQDAMNRYADKELIVFDLDGTLAESKQPVDAEMAGLLERLLAKKKAAVISGGSFARFQAQFLPAFAGSSADLFENLSILPTSGASMYSFKKNGWEKEYSHDLSAAEKEKIRSAFAVALERSGEKMPEKTYGEAFEDRGGQITFSAAGQEAPIGAKAAWDPTDKKRLRIVSYLTPLLPDFSIGIGGMTSIDVTKKSIDKAFGVRELSEHLGIPIERMLYVGDALFPGGNDHAARASGIECVEVAGPSDTKRLIEGMIG